FCVGAPWNSVAVDLGIGHILHFVSDILASAAEKVLAVRSSWAQANPATLAALVRANARAAEFIEDVRNRDEVCVLLATPSRIGVSAEVIRRTLDGRLKVSPDGQVRESERYLRIGRGGAARPDSIHAAWLYGQMVRWRQAAFSPEGLAAAQRVFRPDLYDSILGPPPADLGGDPRDHVGAFVGPPFDPANLARSAG
ncbi:MAG: ABC transporter substrate-binding protein, partial [Xanthobacteraceae bacterium]|nr:ABC transporter substrate-binding protein [Xanthobacteraceae bacterium]